MPNCVSVCWNMYTYGLIRTVKYFGTGCFKKRYTNEAILLLPLLKMEMRLHRPGQLFLQLLSMLVALSKVASLSIHKVSEAPHMVGL